ncbi:MMPL family transporter [Paenibacillus marinisediminis]
MKMVLKARWFIMLVWVIMAAALMLTAPSLSELVKEKGNLTVPEEYSSARAAHLLNKAAAGTGKEHEASIALVFHQPEGLTSESKEQIQKTIQDLEQNKAKLHVVSILNPYSSPELEQKLVAKDGKTVLTSITISTAEVDAREVQAGLKQALESSPVEHYMTSNHQIEHDQIVSSQEGLKKSEFITLLFILTILFVVFRSVVAAFIPLLTIGLSYLISQSIVAILVDTVEFPLSTFTQIFMVAVLFGIGTDYCILLISRFKEELAQHEHTWDAISATYRSAGKTVMFSGLAVLIGFSVIGLSQFILYRSAVAVAIGIAVMLLAIMTVVPFFMAVFGKKLFWPAKGSLEHRESRIWGAVGSFSLKRPWAALLIVAAVTIPLILTHSGKVSFNSLEEISDDYESVKAFNIISESFDPGEAMPTQIVIKSDSALSISEYTILAERVSRELAKVEGVSSVRSLSRPAGEPIAEFQISEQAKSLEEGLNQGKKGLNEIQTGLSQAAASLKTNEPQIKQAVDSVGELNKGTTALKSGIQQLNTGLSEIEKGIRSGSTGASKLKDGLQQAKLSAQQLASAHEKLLASYRQLGGGLEQLQQGIKQIETQLGGASQALQSLNERFSNLESRYPALLTDEDYLTIRGTISESSKGFEQLTAALSQSSASLAQLSEGMKQANAGYAEAAAGQSQLAGGLSSIVAGLEQLASGLDEAASGQQQIVTKIPSIVTGLEQIQNGQTLLAGGFSEFSSQLNELTSGLEQSANGIGQISGGLTSANDYLRQIQSSSDSELGGWLVPDEALQNEAFMQAADIYLSKDRKLMTLDVVFAENPYGTQAIDQVDQLQTAVDRSLKNSSLEQAETAIGGVSSTYNDLKHMSGEDYNRTVMLMMAGILLILIVLMRSFIMPLYLILSLLVTYYASLGATELVFVDLLGYSGITWATPFFGFVMLMALGVDYSIFLMDRFNENKQMKVKDAILYAMRNMGTVIISAVVILGGTFASFYPSGVLSMMQIATVVLTGLILYTFLLLPFFIPVMVRMFGSANWWPFTAKEQNNPQQRKQSA